MRVHALALACLLLGAAPAGAPVGAFQTWLSYKKEPFTFTSGGVGVRVEALPCPARPTGDTSCRWDGYNNQATVTVSAPGVTPVSVRTDGQSAYARIAVVRFRKDDARPGVVIESQYGGSSGAMTAQVLIPAGTTYRVVPVTAPHARYLEGELADFPSDLSGDGTIDLQFRDGVFGMAFGCNACTPRPPQLFAVRHGDVVDESRDPALRGVFAADIRRLRPICLSNDPDRNGACAAYVADAARAGQFEAAWGEMLRHYERSRDLRTSCDVAPAPGADGRCPDGHRTRVASFPDALRAFLTRTGYLPA